MALSPPPGVRPATITTSYSPPSPLEHLYILDLLELTGSQARAGAELAMHQSTVCRSLRLMQKQFQLDPRQGPAVCRHGHNACLRQLRLAYREHRLMAGRPRVGTDPLHQSLLQEPTLQTVPARFRSSRQWAELVGHGLLDGAIVSSWCHGRTLPAGQLPLWDGLRTLELGDLPLQLVAASSDADRVLLPRRAAAPLLHQHLENRQFILEQQSQACQEPDASLKRARDRGWALPLCTPLLTGRWLAQRKLRVLASQAPLRQRLWLLLPQHNACGPLADRLVRQLRAAIARAPGLR